MQHAFCTASRVISTAVISTAAHAQPSLTARVLYSDKYSVFVFVLNHAVTITATTLEYVLAASLKAGTPTDGEC